MNRRDLEAAFAFYHPDVESIWDDRFVSLGFEPLYRGREARVAAQRQWDTEWGEWRLAPDEVIDLGAGRMLMLGRMGGRGVNSGAAVDTDCAFLATFSAGRVTREEVFLSRSEALEAVGLSE
jgi:ketosteroid isomerase-like protein